MKRQMMTKALIALLVFPGLCMAGDVEPGDRPVETLDEMVVSATKTDERRKDVPNAVVVVDDMQISESPAKTLGELLANEPGIDWRTYGDYGGAVETLQIRGMEGKATQVRVNGVIVNSPALGVADISKIPLNSIERIEVVKGSGSVLYGSGAMAGTVNIITKRPRRGETELRASGGCGTESTYLASMEQGMFTGGDVGYYLTANRHKTLGFRSNSDMSRNDASLNLVLDKGDILNVSLYGDYIYRDFGRPDVKPPPGTQSYYLNGVQLYNSESSNLLARGRDNDAHAVLNVNSRPTDWADIKLRGDYSYMDSYNYDRYVFSGTGGGARTWVTTKVFGLEGDVNLKPFSGADLLIGSEYKHYTWENKNINLEGFGADDPASVTHTEAGLHTTGVYMEGQYRPCRYVKGLAAIRHEDHSVFGAEDLPRFGMVVNPFNDTALKINYGKHFLAPTPNDLYWPADPFTSGNPDLKPEKGWHLDLGVEQALLADKVFLALTYFKWDLKDRIIWGPDSNWVWKPQNLDKAKGHGIEIGAKMGPFYDLTLTLDYTYTDAEEENPYVTRRATSTPRDQFKTGLSYWVPFGLTATATVRYMGDRYHYGSDDTLTSPNNILHSYVTMDLRLEQRLFEHWLLSLQANNLFNKAYDVHFGSFTDQASGRTTTAAFPGAGRSVFFQVSYEF